MTAPNERRGTVLPLLYISGPMSGIPDHNRQAFELAAAQVARCGFRAVTPFEVSERWGAKGQQDFPAETYLREDVRVLIDCDAILMLSSWRSSIGARLEAAVAVTLGLRFYEFGGSLHEPHLVHVPAPAKITIDGGYAHATLVVEPALAPDVAIEEDAA